MVRLEALDHKQFTDILRMALADLSALSASLSCATLDSTAAKLTDAVSKAYASAANRSLGGECRLSSVEQRHQISRKNNPGSSYSRIDPRPTQRSPQSQEGLLVQ